VDLLTCGQCQRVFLLSDICRFVQHKVTGCGKDPLLTAANCNSGGGTDDSSGGPPPPLDNGLSATKTKPSQHHNHHHRSQSPTVDDPLAHHHHQRRPPSSSTPKRSSDHHRNNGGGDDAMSSEDEKAAAAGRVKQGSESSEDLGYKKSSNRCSVSSCVDAESNTTNTGIFSCTFIFHPPPPYPEHVRDFVFTCFAFYFAFFFITESPSSPRAPGAELLEKLCNRFRIQPNVVYKLKSYVRLLPVVIIIIIISRAVVEFRVSFARRRKRIQYTRLYI
jgi:hypothetical protein